jgi:hypothetical protein
MPFEIKCFSPFYTIFTPIYAPTYHPNMKALFENVVNWSKWHSFLMLNLIFKVKFAIEIKLDTEKNQIHNKLGARLQPKVLQR